MSFVSICGTEIIFLYNSLIVDKTHFTLYDMLEMFYNKYELQRKIFA